MVDGIVIIPGGKDAGVILTGLAKPVTTPRSFSEEYSKRQIARREHALGSDVARKTPAGEYCAANIGKQFPAYDGVTRQLINFEVGAGYRLADAVNRGDRMP